MNIFENERKVLIDSCRDHGRSLIKVCPGHKLLIFFGSTVTPEEVVVLKRRFYAQYGKPGINRDAPTIAEQIEAYKKYRLDLITALIIERARRWGDLPNT